MIRPLRRRHYRLFVALGLLLPAAFALGIVARRAVPGADSLPTELMPAAAAFDWQEWQRADLFTNSPVQVRLLREHNGAGKFAVAFSAGKNFIKPDLIVYWVKGNPALTGTLPDNAVLLGGFGSAALPLPPEAGTSDGVLVLFSLADNEIVDATKPARFNGNAK